MKFSSLTLWGLAVTCQGAAPCTNERYLGAVIYWRETVIPSWSDASEAYSQYVELMRSAYQHQTESQGESEMNQIEYSKQAAIESRNSAMESKESVENLCKSLLVKFSREKRFECIGPVEYLISKIRELVPIKQLK